ncbi:YncE family protein [Arenibacter palladensis]|uniref:YncE family protein n=1 Tax=Arenibacter palladensis TaxID=237373 RepID=UPI002FD24EAC
MKIRNVFLSLLIIGLSWSCSNDDEEIQEPMGDYENGILVSNEGPFSNGTGTVTFISEDLSVVNNEIYKMTNGEDLGNVVQSIGFTEDEAFIVANVSNKINVVNRYTFEKIASITEGLNNPRYFIEANGKGYVTNWGDTADETDDFVAIINLESYTVEGIISVVLGPEAILANGNMVYVAHQGAWGQNNKVSVINTASNEVINTLTVGDVPNSMELDASGNLWVLASGKPAYTGDETSGVLSKINTGTNEVDSNIQFESTEHPSSLNLDGGVLYYHMGDKVFEQNLSATTLSKETVLEGVSFYTMVVNNGRLYGTDAGDYASNGTLTVYDLNTKLATEEITVGIIPGGIYFN